MGNLDQIIREDTIKKWKKTQFVLLKDRYNSKFYWLIFFRFQYRDENKHIQEGKGLLWEIKAIFIAEIEK